MVLALAEVDRLDELIRVRDRKGRQLPDVLFADGYGQRLRLEARALALRARDLAHVLLDLADRVLALGALVLALQPRDHAFVVRPVRARPAVPVAVLHVHLVVAGPVQEDVPLRLRQLPPRRRRLDLQVAGHRFHELVEVLGPPALPGVEGPLGQRHVRIRHHELGIHFEVRSQPVAARARAVRRVEREVPRLQLFERQAVEQAREVLRVCVDRAAVDELDRDHPIGKAERRLDGVGETPLDPVLHHEPVDDDVDRVLVIAVKPDLLGELLDLTVDLGAREALLREVGQKLLVLPLALTDDRSEDLEPRALGQRAHLVDDLVRRLLRDRAAAFRAVRLADARVQQAEVVVDLGDGADRRPRVLRRRFLVDRDRRRQSVDEVDVGLLHLAEELARIRRQAFDVPPLALGVDRVERER